MVNRIPLIHVPLIPFVHRRDHKRRVGGAILGIEQAREAVSDQNGVGEVDRSS